MDFGDSRSRPLIPGFPGAPVQLEEPDLAKIPFQVFFDKPAPDGTLYRGTTVAVASDQEFDVWIEHMYSKYLLDESERNDHRWPMGRRLALCNRLWQHREIWGLTYVNEDNMIEGDRS